MKSNIHPTYYELTVTCACGNSFHSGSTKDAITTDICSRCHPFFTGEMKFVDRMGRVEKFQAKQQNASGKKKKKDRKSTKVGPLTLSDIRSASAK